MSLMGKGVIFFICIVSLIFTLPSVIHAQAKIVEVTAENAKIYARPDINSEVIQAAPVGQVYNMIEKVGSWYKVQFTTARLNIQMEGYIHERYVKVLGEEPPVRVTRVPREKKGPTVVLVAIGSYFQPSDQAFKNIYGGGTNFGGEINITLMKGISLWAGMNMFSKTGLTTFTEEETEISITPVYGGIKFQASGARVRPYLGLGVGYFQYKESSAVIGSVQKSDIGYLGQLGVLINVIGPIYLDLKGSYSYCKVQPEDLEANIGGLQVMAGFGLGF